MSWPTSRRAQPPTPKTPVVDSRRAQAPTPVAPVVDASCNTTLSNIVALRAARVFQVNSLLYQVLTANCTSTSRRLKRIMKDKRILQAPTPTPTQMCDTAEKAVQLVLANLAMHGTSYLMKLAAVGIMAAAAMFF